MPTITPDELCEQYGYSHIIADHLKQICAALQTANVSSIYLTGSTSRGELTYKESPTGELVLFSDYEFIVVPNTSTAWLDKNRAFTHLAQLEAQFGSNSPLFHIDVVWVDHAHVTRLPHIFQIFEAKSTGITLSGNELSSRLPNVNLGTLDFFELNEILIWRLWAMLLYLPKGFLLRGESDDLYSYVLCRNALDLTTWALPHDRILLPSFKRRASYIEDQFLNLATCQAIDANFPHWLNIYKIGKFEIRFQHTTFELYETIIRQFERAIIHLSNLRKISPGHSGFHNWKLKRKGYEVLRMWRGQSNLLHGIRWLLQPKYDIQLACLVDFHRATLMHLGGQHDEAKQLLALVHSELSCLLPWGMPVSSNDDFTTQWLSLRRWFAEFLMQFSYSVGRKRSYLERVLVEGHAQDHLDIRR